MVSPFYITPAGESVGSGLAGLGQVIRETRAAQEEKAAIEAQQQRQRDMAAAIFDAYQNPNPSAWASVVEQYPEAAQMAMTGMGVTQEFQRKEMADFAMDALLNPQNAVAAAEKRIALGTDQGRDMSDTQEFLEAYRQDPEVARKMAERALISADMDMWKAYQQMNEAEKDTLLVGDLLVDKSSGETIRDFAGMTRGEQEQYAVTPVYMRNAEGQYQAVFPGNRGGQRVMGAADGFEVVPDSGRLGFTPASISERGAAEATTALETAPTRGRATRAEELAAMQGQRAGAVASKEAQFELLDQVANEVRDQAGIFTTGLLGSATARIAGTPAADLAANLDTLQAAAGFEKLQEMRDNSPTGGALGSVTERELALLQATWGSISQSQSKEQFLRNLKRFQDKVKDSWERVEAAYERDYGQPYTGSPLAPSGAPMVPAAGAPATGGARLVFNPATGELE
jgi:hypothetical protein